MVEPMAWPVLRKGERAHLPARCRIVKANQRGSCGECMKEWCRGKRGRRLGDKYQVNWSLILALCPPRAVDLRL